MTAKEYLSQARQLNRKIDSKTAVLSGLRAMAEKTTSVLSKTVVSSNRNTHSMEDTIARIVDLENEINADIDRLVEMKAEITGAIRAIENQDYQTVLELRYLCYMDWDEMAKMMNRTKSNMYKLHNKALEMIKVPKNDIQNGRIE